MTVLCSTNYADCSTVQTHSVGAPALYKTGFPSRPAWISADNPAIVGLTSWDFQQIVPMVTHFEFNNLDYCALHLGFSF